MLKKNLPGWLVGETPRFNDLVVETPSNIDEELRQAYRAATVTSMESFSPAMPSEPAFGSLSFEGMPMNEAGGSAAPLLQRLLNKPRLAAGLVITLCLAASATYAGLGAWFVMSGSQAEPLAMLNLQEADTLQGDAKHLLSNIQTLQQQAEQMKNLPVEAPETPLTQKLSGTEEAYTLLNLNDGGLELTGRPDPFAPLVQTTGPIGMPTEPSKPEKIDVLTLMQYTGFIGDNGSKDRVAILHLNDPASGERTLIRKVGDSFLIGGERVTLKAVAKNTLHLKVGGKIRTLALTPFQDTVTASAPGGSSSTGNASSSAGGTASAGNSQTNSNSASGKAGNGANPELQEPK
jgi:hypothetical protein